MLRLTGAVILAGPWLGCTEHGERVVPDTESRNNEPAQAATDERSAAASKCVAEHPSSAADPSMIRLVGACTRALGGPERCDPEHLLSAEAAKCTAWAWGVHEGIAAPEVKAIATRRGPFWRIVTITSEGPSSRRGESWRVDARTGAVEQGLGWGEDWD